MFISQVMFLFVVASSMMLSPAIGAVSSTQFWGVLALLLAPPPSQVQDKANAVCASAIASVTATAAISKDNVVRIVIQPFIITT